MFEEVVINPDYTLGVLSIEKLLHNHLGAVMGTPIDEDYLYECMYEAIAEIAQDVADGFQWGMTALPALDADSIGYSYTFLEQAWIPSGAEHIDEAKTFLSYLYSDEAASIFAKGGAVQPILGMTDQLEGDNKLFYSIYDNGAGAAMGGFAAYSPIPGIDNTSVFFEPINSLVEGSLSIDEWRANIISATDQMRANLVA